jgi:hypothetical protein
MASFAVFRSSGSVELNSSLIFRDFNENFDLTL